MAYGSQSRTVQESVAPYFKSVAADTTNGNKASRGLMVTTSLAQTGVTITFADGSTVSQTMLAGVVYPFAAIKVDNANIAFLY